MKRFPLFVLMIATLFLVAATGGVSVRRTAEYGTCAPPAAGDCGIYDAADGGCGSTV